ncbi:AI-2E family transporter [Chloroflexus sp.]|uniref:AI-2E family transporter n=1 Tax=Chloroflexus sp. TaxID=1904827 RepID=UPI00404A063E
MGQEERPIRFSYQAKWISGGLIVVLTIWLLFAVTHILPPFIGAIITAYLFNPLIGWLHRRTRIGRAIWIIVLYIVAFFVLYSLFTALWPRIVQQSRDLAANAPVIIRELTIFFEQNQTIEVGDFVISLAPLEAQVIGLIRDVAGWLSGNVPKIVFSALESVIYLLVYLIITFYLLLQAPQLKAWSRSLIPAPYRREIGHLGYQIDRVFSAYIRGQLILIVIMSVLLYIPLSLLQVPYALVIAVASGVLEILPIIGPWSAAGIAMTVAFFQPVTPFGLSNVALAVLLGIIYFVLRQIEDHFIIPNVMGPLVRLHPGVVIFAILAGGALAGAFGLFISIPIAAVIRILLSYIYRKLTDQPETPSDTDQPHTATRQEAVTGEVALGSQG